MRYVAESRTVGECFETLQLVQWPVCIQGENCSNALFITIFVLRIIIGWSSCQLLKRKQSWRFWLIFSHCALCFKSNTVRTINTAFVNVELLSQNSLAVYVKCLYAHHDASWCFTQNLIWYWCYISLRLQEFDRLLNANDKHLDCKETVLS